MQISNLYIYPEIINIIDQYHSWKPIFNECLVDIIKGNIFKNFHTSYRGIHASYCKKCGDFTRVWGALWYDERDSPWGMSPCVICECEEL